MDRQIALAALSAAQQGRDPFADRHAAVPRAAEGVAGFASARRAEAIAAIAVDTVASGAHGHDFVVLDVSRDVQHQREDEKRNTSTSLRAEAGTKTSSE
jgi:hypothetical protein